MKVYHYDEEGVFVGSSEADPSPLEPGVFLVPANATPAAPPEAGDTEAGEGEVAVFDGTDWTLHPDHRGTIYWQPDGTEVEIDRIGVAPPEDALSDPPPAPPSRADVFAQRDRRLALGATISVAGYGDVPVRGRIDDMIAYLSVKDMAHALQDQGVTAPAITLRDAANTLHTLTPAQAIALISQAQAVAQEIYAASWALLDAPDLPEDVASDAHWP